MPRYHNSTSQQLHSDKATADVKTKSLARHRVIYLPNSNQIYILRLSINTKV